MSAYNALQTFAWPSGVYYFQQPWTLLGSTYLLTCRWNWRASFYALDLADASATTIVAGIPLRAGRNLLAPYTSYAIPDGALFVYDNTGAQADPQKDSFASTHSLLFAYTDTGS